MKGKFVEDYIKKNKERLGDAAETYLNRIEIKKMKKQEYEQE